MSSLPSVPPGSGEHPIGMIVLSANNLAASTAFYTKVFGWHVQSVSPELAGAVASGGPSITFRAGTPEGFQGMVPMIVVSDVQQALDQVVAAGGSVERAPWTVPMMGTIARFKDPAGTVYGLTSAFAAGTIPAIPIPFGDAPSPPNGSICSVEMHAGDLDAAARFFGEQFGWGTESSMPQYLTFDPGAGVAGVFQSHTPATRAVPYIYVATVAATLDAIDAAGGKRMGAPMPIPGRTTFGYFSDPSGTPMGLMGG